ncbi:hypothetical protein ON010_g13156 [Phytophthora cinnamomi]|nr:hypothetical protein ON010_g13156 [Phytophthora cinnamomi]
MLGAWHGHADVVELLLRSGADVAAKEKSRSTALRFAAGAAARGLVSGRGGGARMEEGPPPRGHRDRNGWTPLILATWHDHINVVKFLPEDADIDAKDAGGSTAMRFAASEGRLKVAKLLVEHGSACVNEPQVFGCTPLWFAVAIKLFVPVPKAGESFDDQTGRWFGLRHPNVQKLYGAVRESYNLFVCEHVAKESLDDSSPEIEANTPTVGKQQGQQGGVLRVPVVSKPSGRHRKQLWKYLCQDQSQPVIAAANRWIAELKGQQTPVDMVKLAFRGFSLHRQIGRILAEYFIVPKRTSGEPRADARSQNGRC